MAQITNNALGKIGRASILTIVALTLAGCEEGKTSNPFKSNGTNAADESATTSRRSGRKVSQDVEAPDVFQVTDSGLWDGRPSLGGIWVAHSDVKDPERVIIRNMANGKSITGALFRRERENPGPKFQASSDAAAALGMLAGQPVKLSVIALRREEIEEPVIVVAPVISDEVPTTPVPPATKPQARPATVKTPPKTSIVSGTIEQTTLDPIASAAAAIEAADGKTTDGDDATPAPAPVVEPAGTPKPLFALAKSYVQLATFSDEAGATEAADTLRAAGMEPVVKEQGDASGWRVLVGPAANRKQRTALAKQLKGLGFTDAHFVKE